MNHFCNTLAAAAALFVLFGFVMTESANSQTKQLDSAEDLEEFVRFKNSGIFHELATGARQNVKADEKLIQLAARYFVYGTTIKSLHGPEIQFKRRELLTRHLSTAKLHLAKNANFRKTFINELLYRFKNVFALEQNGNQVSLTNAGLLLPILAELGDPDLAKFCAKLVKDNKPIVVQLFAFKALKTHFETNPLRLKKYDLNKHRLEELAILIDPVVEFVKKPPANVSKMSTEEIDGYRFVRCEAIKALARTRLPWVPMLASMKNGKPPVFHAPVAYLLMRVLAEGKSGLTPPASLDEQVEAVKGLCVISANNSYVGDQRPYYNAEPAVKLIGQALTRFAEEYAKDREKFKVKGNKLPTLLLWKHTSQQLEKVVQQLPANLPRGSNAQLTAQKISKEALIVFGEMKFHRSVNNIIALQQTYKSLKVNPIVYRGFSEKIMVD